MILQLLKKDCIIAKNYVAAVILETILRFV